MSKDDEDVLCIGVNVCDIIIILNDIGQIFE